MLNINIPIFANIKIRKMQTNVLLCLSLPFSLYFFSVSCISTIIFTAFSGIGKKGARISYS